MMPYHSTAYGWLTLAGIFVSIFLWSRVARRDNRLVLIYVAALAGAFLGAKIVYLAAEGWLHWHDANRWVVLATGKSITGALLGGYAAVEAAKRQVVRQAFDQVNHDHEQAAKILGLHPNYLHKLIRTMNLKPALKRTRR